MKKKLKKIPFFKTEDDERDFWSDHDSTEYIDLSHPIKMSFPNLKFSSSPITIRVPNDLIDNIKIMANKRDVPYQSLIKMFLWEKVKAENYPSKSE